MEFPVLITVPGRPPLYLKCHSAGHVRYECNARVSGARAGAFAEVELEEEGEMEEERRKRDSARQAGKKAAAQKVNEVEMRKAKELEKVKGAEKDSAYNSQLEGTDQLVVSLLVSRAAW